MKLFSNFYKLFFYLLDDIVFDTNLSENIEPDLQILENDLLFNETEENSSQVESMVQIKPVTTLLRCAAHSLQLCVEDTLKVDAVHSVVARAREVLYISN